MARVTATGARVLIMRSIITAQFDPLNCLSTATYVDHCHVPLPRIACPAAPLCEAMLDGINVWRNPNHYSTRILVHFRAAIWAAMAATGVFTGLTPRNQ